ncbi:MAG: hypothetical protein WC205_16710 [Opitutaceae bacterium]|jgi:hypothetical protein
MDTFEGTIDGTPALFHMQQREYARLPDGYLEIVRTMTDIIGVRDRTGNLVELVWQPIPNSVAVAIQSRSIERDMFGFGGDHF